MLAQCYLLNTSVEEWQNFCMTWDAVDEIKYSLEHISVYSYFLFNSLCTLNIWTEVDLMLEACFISLLNG